MISENLQIDLFRALLLIVLIGGAIFLTAIFFGVLNKISRKLDQILESLKK